MIARGRGSRLDDPRLVWAGCGASLALGLAFAFVRAPHPWGWGGFDHYDDLARQIAIGRPYPTFDRLWGYPYFLAAFYRVFGERPGIPIAAQVALNATIPYLIYREVRRRIDVRTAVVAALLVGVLSLNTVYASTQASEALCTFLYVAAVIAFGRAQSSPSAAAFAAAGLLAGLALIVRPNLLLFPVFIVAIDLVMTRGRRRPRHAAAFVVAAALVWAPWPIRNARLSGRFIPSTTHGGIVFWISTLQVGRYAENWTANPRASIEFGPFDYSAAGPVRVDVSARPGLPMPTAAALIYWTDRAPARIRLEGSPALAGTISWDLPEQPAGTVLHYYVDAEFRTAAGVRRQTTPPTGARDPLLHFISRDHFADLDRHDELLDVFDVVRLIRCLAWGEPPRNRAALDLDRDGALTRADLDLAIGALVAPALLINRAAPGALKEMTVGQDSATVILTDDSSLTVPRAFSGQLTDLDVRGIRAADMIRSKRSFISLALTPEDAPEAAHVDPYLTLVTGVNSVFYRSEPLLQDRYNALAWANLRRTPGLFVATSLRRIARLFVSVGSTDTDRAAQFAHSGAIYAVATAASAIQFVLLVAGAIVAMGRRLDAVLLLAAIAYVPATLFLFMTTARYLVIAQPFILVFAAVALTSIGDAVARRRWPA